MASDTKMCEGLLKHLLETRRYGMEIRGAVKTNWHYTSIAARKFKRLSGLSES